MTIEIKEMTEEDINLIYAEANRYAMITGFESHEAMENFKVDATQGMIMFGGSFTHFLGHALARADAANTAKIIRSFKSICEEHAELYIKHMKNRNMPKED